MASENMKACVYCDKPIELLACQCAKCLAENESKKYCSKACRAEAGRMRAKLKREIIYECETGTYSDEHIWWPSKCPRCAAEYKLRLGVKYEALKGHDWDAFERRQREREQKRRDRYGHP